VRSDSLARRRRRRRGSADDPLSKVTFQIHESVMDQVRAAVDDGAAPSLNAFMERAADNLLRELRRVEVYEAYGAAAQDSKYMAEQAAVIAEGETSLSDGLQEGPGVAESPTGEARSRRRKSSGSGATALKDR